MNISTIAARFRKIVDEIDAIVAKSGDHEFPDQMLQPLVLNLFADEKAMEGLRRVWHSEDGNAELQRWK